MRTLLSRSTELARRQFFHSSAFKSLSRRSRAMKHAPQPWFPIAASSVVDGTSARDCLVSFGADPESVDAMFERHPEVREYDVATEIAPRMSYLQFLEGRGELGDETAAECALRQPGILERKYETVFECPSRGYVAVNKPFAVRLDTPRGWLETDVDGNRV